MLRFRPSRGKHPARRVSGALAAALAAGALLAGCGGRRPDIVLISIDTLRADHLGCYGEKLPTSPHLDAFRADSVMFRTVEAQAPSTLASHASLFTSELPAHHGASFARLTALPDSAVTLAEVLAREGYRTVGLTAGGQLDPVFGVGQGFQTYRAETEKRRPGAFARRVAEGLRELDASDRRPLFLFLHTYETHHPYTPAPGILKRLDPGYRGRLGDRISIPFLEEVNAGRIRLDAADVRHVERAYSAEIVSADRGFGQLIDGLRERHRYRDTLIVVTSDHGEEFDEHGTLGWHSHTLYEELLRVPLLVHLPGGADAGREVALPVRSIDIAPTILELAGVASPDTFDGRSLVPLMRGEDLPELPQVAELDDDAPPAEAATSVRFRGWKLIGTRLFDLGADPGEQVSRSGDDTARWAEMIRIANAALAHRPGASTPGVHLDEKFERELRALGYLD
jgi:arylsulfatase A-like enzyme